jgi:hypothetical protein
MDTRRKKYIVQVAGVVRSGLRPQWYNLPERFAFDSRADAEAYIARSMRPEMYRIRERRR